MLVDEPGTVALPTSEIGRFTIFTISLAGLLQPPESMLSVMASASVTQNLNATAVTMMARPDDQWLWIIGDDHVFERDTLLTMLGVLDDNPEIDILVPLVVKRNPPWHVGLFHNVELEDTDGTPLFRPYTWAEIPLPESGVTEFEVDAAGNAGMLMRRSVVEAMTEGDQPLFYSTIDKQGRQVILNEDVTFCTRARKEGFTLYATTQAFLGHLGVYNVRPLNRDGRWGAMTEFSSADDAFKELFMPLEASQQVPVV